MARPSPTVVALGELLWDLFPDAARFGGAPGNFAHHAASLGADVWMVSGVGADDLGSSALDQLRASGLHVDHVGVSEQFQLELVALTRGDRGGMLIRGGEVSEVESRPIEIIDTVGAGDAFTAAVVVGQISQAELHTVNQVACRIAEFVCAQGGATPRLPEELRVSFGNPQR